MAPTVTCRRRRPARSPYFGLIRAIALVGLLLVAALAVAPGAGAHGGRSASSAHFLSTVLGVTPPVPGLDLSVADRDDRLVMVNRTGKTVMVRGYTYEPYLRFDTRGVWVNMHSPSRWLDAMRVVPETFRLPEEANEKLPPKWTLLTTQNTWEWHDHRIHWASTVSPEGSVQPVNGKFDLRDWEVPIVVAGAPAIIKGRLDFFVKAQGTGGDSRLGTILAIVLPVAAVLAVGGGWLLVRRRRCQTAAA